MLRLVVYLVVLFLLGCALTLGIPTALSAPNTIVNLLGAIIGALCTAGTLVFVFKGGNWVLNGLNK